MVNCNGKCPKPYVLSVLRLTSYILCLGSWFLILENLSNLSHLSLKIIGTPPFVSPIMITLPFPDKASSLYALIISYCS